MLADSAPEEGVARSGHEPEHVVSLIDDAKINRRDDCSRTAWIASGVRLQPPSSHRLTTVIRWRVPPAHLEGRGAL